MQLKYGVVAILDALGAADYRESEIKRFLQSREQVLAALNQKAEDITRVPNSRHFTTFTFNDTILVVLEAQSSRISPEEVRDFFKVMRKFITDSLDHRILFRGSLALGGFYIDEATNIIMGEAVTDAAAWYDQTDWIGLVATPRSTMEIRFEERRTEGDWRYLMLDYDVPAKDGQKISLKVVNWPKAFLVPSLTPCKNGEEPRVKLLELLSLHRGPRGTERKYFNTIEFFDRAITQSKDWDKDQEAKRLKKSGLHDTPIDPNTPHSTTAVISIPITACV